MPKKIRVYELARELGIDNKHALALADELKIGVKSHSSSIEEAQADRVRRLAHEQGIAKPPEVIEADRRVGEEAKREADDEQRAREEAERRAVEEAARAEQRREEEERRAQLEAVRGRVGQRVIRSTVQSVPIEEVERPEVARPRPAARPAPEQAEAPAAAAATRPEVEPDVDAAVSSAAPRSPTGRPIPPPPGLGGRRAPLPPSRGRPPSGRGAPAPARVGPPARGAPPGRGRPGMPPRRRKKKRRRRLEELEPQQPVAPTPADAPVPEGEIVVPRGITPQEYGPTLNRTAADVVRLLMEAGEMVTATQSLGDEMVELIADELGAEIVLVDPGQEEEVELQVLLAEADDDDDDALHELRPPIVTVMGHVDHGKTLLLDKIRETNVVEGEAGGITQHIGAYQAGVDGRRITFIDTPGHEAFTAMRARGARATDIAVLVVAADDGVMPQTVEAIEHVRAADVPIVVAINKVDKPEANPERVKQQLSEHGLVPEAWGGDTVMTEVSALTGQGVSDLLESILLVAEVEELTANPKAPGRAIVLEGNLDPGRGAVATVIVQRGTLRVSDPVVAGPTWGRVRALLDEHGEQLEEVGPSSPVEVLGLADVPMAGDELRVAPDEKVARVVAEARARRHRRAELAGTAAVATAGTPLEELFEQIQAGEVTTLNLILKADVQGSVEALTTALARLERDDVKLNFVGRGVGGITENDVTFAMASAATIIGFGVRPDRIARELAEREGVEIRLYDVIYEVIDEIKAAMLGMLAPEYEEVVSGEAEVREIFNIPRVGRVAGCYVQNGTIRRGDKVRFLRDGVVIWKGEVSSLKRFKDDAREVQSGFECGVGLSDFQDLKPGDVIETYELREIERV